MPMVSNAHLRTPSRPRCCHTTLIRSDMDRKEQAISAMDVSCAYNSFFFYISCDGSICTTLLS